MIDTIKNIIVRDLEKLKKEISLYKNEERIWVLEGDIANTAGNLCLHLVGNLKTYVGAVMGQSGYVRNRDLEFSLKNISQKELIRMVEETIAIVQKTMDQMRDEQLAEEYPLLVFSEKTSTAYMFIHLVSHLGYHLGQVNYHRRLLDI